MTMMDKRPLTKRERRRRRRAIAKSHKVLVPGRSRSVSVKVDRQPSATELRRVKRVQRRQRIAMVMCDRLKLPKRLEYLDYRYWQARSCFGADIDAPGIYAWWCDLHWQHREEIHRLSRSYRSLRRS